ncbi:unnamed protein product [Discosporangium mesarthrocarpum]
MGRQRPIPSQLCRGEERAGVGPEEDLQYMVWVAALRFCLQTARRGRGARLGGFHVTDIAGEGGVCAAYCSLMSNLDLLDRSATGVGRRTGRRFRRGTWSWHRTFCAKSSRQGDCIRWRGDLSTTIALVWSTVWRSC